MLKLSPLYKWVYETASKDSFVSIEKAEKILGYQPKFSNKDALINNYKWYIEHQHEFKNKSGISPGSRGNRAFYGLPRFFSKEEIINPSLISTIYTNQFQIS